MSETLKRWTDWLIQPVIKSMACPAFSTMDLLTRQAAAPQHDITSDHFQVNSNPAEGCHLRRQSAGTKEPLNEAVVTGYLDDDLNWQRFLAAKQGTVSLDQRTKAGLQRRKEYQAAWRETKKKEIRAAGVLRDGPQYGAKQCRTCSEFIPKTSGICPKCQVPATRQGALAAINSNSQPRSETSVSNQNATDALHEAMCAQNLDSKFSVAEIWGRRSQHGKTKYHVQWAGYSKNKMTWEREENLRDDEGNWTCARAMERFLAKGS